MRTIAGMYEQPGVRQGVPRLLVRLLRFGELPPATVERVEVTEEPVLLRWAERLLDA
jgi:hypothetical protein